jgi:membrane-bound inhibitor of C-type lysozyme
MRIAVLIAAFTLGACQTPCPAPNPDPVTATYNCVDGSDLVVTFTRAPEAARVVQSGYVTLDLPARQAASGYRYSDGGAELRGRRSETMWMRPGAAETLCRAAR